MPKTRNFSSRDDARTWATYSEYAIVSIDFNGDYWVVTYIE